MTVPAPSQLLDFAGQTVLVTGAGSGLGRGIAARFAEAGASVVVNYLNSAAGAESVVAEIQNRGGRAVAVRADVTDQSAVERLIAAALAAFGRLDVLINNAGAFPTATLLDMTEAQWDTVLDANLRSVFLCTQAAARQMIVQGQGGAIVNIASIEAEDPAPEHSHYNAAKGGVVMHARAAALELAPHNIRVNIVSPGLIWAEGIEQSWPDGVARWQKRALLKRLG